jgi:alpha-tubulin suppressor-like RCC1 family protein
MKATKRLAIGRKLAVAGCACQVGLVVGLIWTAAGISVAEATKVLKDANALTSGALISSGGYHCLALNSDGIVWVWGLNWNGQLGDGTTTSRNAPAQVCACGLTRVVGVGGGECHSLAVKTDGTVWAWGHNTEGQLGDGTVTQRHTPVQTSGLIGVVAIASGVALHSLALKSDGTVWAWGRNGDGELGDGTTANRNTPVRVSGLTGVMAIAAGYEHSLAVKSNGTVWAWGYNGYGQLGDGTVLDRHMPVQITALTRAVAIAAGGVHSLAVKSDGTVWAWGDNGYGQLGDGTTTFRLTPVRVSGLTGVANAAGGYGHSLAVKSNGTVWAWGNNATGQLGDGTTTDRHTPVKTSGLTGVVAVASGYDHSLAVKFDGTIWAWGGNSFGQIGDGTTTDRHLPVLVTGFPDTTDSDGDGIPDAWMQLYFGHPTGQAGDSSRATDDPDGDGRSNEEEYAAGTIPIDASSGLRITSITANPGGRFVIQWSSVAGKCYAVQRNTNLNWNTVLTLTNGVAGTPPTNTYTDPSATNAPAYFFRIRLVP